ncbi:hypothetical protein JQ543_13775 [Bradyrhizobium diazoefficiens]|nr:hypothetical protein [Bradyrhizobium diazoefficiens]MBR0848817.1 hypothetical protein [Bradyrhizobium diazoefficiens]
MIRTNGRTALVILAGLLLLFAGAAQAAPSSRPDGASKQADAARPTKQRRHTSSHRATGSKTAQKPSDDKASKTEAAASTDEAKADAKAGNDQAGNDKAGNDAPTSSLMPPQVANANAQLAAADTPTAAAASAMTSRAANNVQAAADNGAALETPAVAPDPSSDVGRARDTAQDTTQDNAQNTPPAPKAVIAATDAQPRPAPVLAASVQQGSAWDQSSLIGKIFIGFGALLTLASAARMFMA